MRALTSPLVGGLLAMALILGTVGSASAETYTVTRTDDPTTGPCEPGDCSLREALTASNNSTTVDDVVILPAAAAPYLIQDESFTLPIADEVEIRGAGAGVTVVKGNPEGVAFTIGGFKTTLVGLTITGAKGAIENNGALTLRRVSIEHNERDITAGGISSGGPVTIESSFLGYNHTKTATGGAIHSNGPVTIVNSTIAHNSSEAGPAAMGVNDLLTIRSSAVVSNRSEAAGSAGAAAIELTVRDSIFADNRNATGLRNCSSGTPISLGGNVSDDASCGAGATDKPNVNPLLGTLALHGGTTLIYELLAGSPAIDAAIECPSLDQRGVARPQGPACDSGPYEFQPRTVSILLPDPDRFRMRLGKKSLKLDRKGFVRVRLTCVVTETGLPCRGKITLQGRFHYGGGSGLRPPKVRYPTARFKIAEGKSKGVRIRIPPPTVERLRNGRKHLKTLVVVSARDGAGNFLGLRAPRKLVPR